MREFLRKLGWLPRRSRREAELREELEFHLDAETEEHQDAGMPAAQARQAALREFGNVALVQEDSRAAWGWTILEQLGRDLRYGARMLRLNPGFAAVAFLSLSLGIGANAAIFQLIDAVRLRYLPVENPRELATVRILNREWMSGNFNGRYPDLTYALWEQIRDRQQAFSGTFAWGPETFNLAPGGEARLGEGIWVSGEFFQVLGVRPLLGRVFTVDDDGPACGSPGAVISYAFWQREFGGDGSVIGRNVTLNGYPLPIVGVTPADFFGVEVGRRFDVAVPLCSEPLLMGEDTQIETRHAWWLGVMGRLKPGWSVDRATAHLQAISPAVLEATIPPRYNSEQVYRYLDYRLGAVSGASGFSTIRDSGSTPLWLLLAITGLVLLIACANLANLMLARASARQREIAVRLALGASRGRVVRQLLSESVLLATAGTVGGVFLAGALSRSLLSLLSMQANPLFLNTSLDWRLLAFTASLAAVTCILFGLIPAATATRKSPVSTMKAGGRGLTPGRERFGLRRALVVSQVALSCVLLVSALLFVRSLSNLLTLDAGFDQDGVVVARVDLTALDLPVERRHSFKQELIDRVRAIPGVESAAGSQMVPIGNSTTTRGVMAGGEQKGRTLLNVVTPDYFATFGMPLLAGRDFEDRDTASSPGVAIVNELFVERYLDATNPIGATFQLEAREGEVAPTFEIVGVVGNAKWRDLRDELEPMAFLASLQDKNPDESLTVSLRATAPLDRVLPALRDAIRETSPTIAFMFRVFRNQVSESVRPQLVMATLSGFFGLLAILLAAIGLYGVMSYLVARRRNEIGIRMALGAGRADVVGMILKEAGVLMGIGLATGLVLAAVAARAAASLLFGLGPNDPTTLMLAAAGLATVGILSSFLPARRAANVNPVTALREE